MAYPNEQQYLDECKRIAGPRWEEFNELYSFKTAYEEGVPARCAVKDAKEWIDA